MLRDRDDLRNALSLAEALSNWGENNDVPVEKAAELVAFVLASLASFSGKDARQLLEAALTMWEAGEQPKS